MHIVLPLSFLVLHAALLALPAPWSATAAYGATVLGPMAACAACEWRARVESGTARLGWRLVVLSLGLWALGAIATLWHELIEGRANDMYRSAMLAFNLAAVPLTLLVASDGWAGSRRLVRGIDGVLALALCQGYFLYTWGMLTARGAPDEAGVWLMVWLLDAQHLLLSLGALVRWYVAEDAAERRLFGALSVYEIVYLALMVLNNHFIAGDPAYGPQISSAVTLAFAVLASAALRPRGPDAATFVAHPTLVRAVRSAQPFLLSGALLILSLFLIRIDYAHGAAGVVIAVLGYAWRNTAAEVINLERGDRLQRERSELQNIAWTDALTGVPNRHGLDLQLAAVGRGPQRPQSMAVLMIDIDHFKRLNDRFGHPAGDACLRDVARVLQQALVRPGDMLARYGGEEFIALLHDADLGGAVVVAERLREAVEGLRIDHPDSTHGVVTVSVGVALSVAKDSLDADRLVREADKALYEAKCAGRNRVVARASD